MNNLLSRSWVALLTLALLPACSGGGSHADTGVKPDTGKDTGGDDTGATDTAMGEGGTDAGPDAAGSCPAAGTCGGKLVGSWTIASSCLDVDVSGSVPDYCPTATAQSMGFQITGTLTYKADLTYSKQTTINGKVVTAFPASCLTGADGGAPLTCAMLETQLKLDNSYAAVTCAPAPAGGGCACTGTLAPQNQTTTGMYTSTAAGLLIETETGRTPPDRSDYCITTDTLKTSPHAMPMGMGMAASGTITATRVAAPAPDAGTDAGTDATSDAGPSSDATADAGGDATGG